jgi:tetratricopeptide (TPR) repeat protein
MRAALNATTLLLAAAIAGVPAVATPLDSQLKKAQALEQQGRLKDARSRYHLAAETFRAANDERNLATALSAAAWISVLLGDYREAIHDAEQVVPLRRALRDDSGLSLDLNTIGLAYENLGNYPAAMDHYRQALNADRAGRNVAGEITRLNNIGNIYYFQGRYTDALESYRSALQLVDASAGQSWNPRERKLTIGNMATLYQRLGLEDQALALYQQVPGRPEGMPASEYAHMLLNEGVLYRHLGDPVKALEVYHTSQALFRTARHADGEIGALRNIGIVKVMDLDDLAGALQAFADALRLSRESANNRNVVQASLYLGEVLRRLHRYKEAIDHLQEALATAQKAGMVEEQWKALYVLGRIAEETGSAQDAIGDYRASISIIESIRAGLRAAALRTDFLAGKRDVYDSLIAFELRQPQPANEELLHWMERSRARTLQDRLASRTALLEPRLSLLQARLPPDVVLVEWWMGNQESIAVWVTAGSSGIVRLGGVDSLRREIAQLLAALQSPSDEWKPASRELGSRLLAGIPLRNHMIVVQDGTLNFPVEVLGIPGSDMLLIEQCDVSYLPSARLIAMPETRSHRWLLPWDKQLVAIGDPPVSSADTLAQEEHWQPLPASADEVLSIARMIPGRAETHLGADARKAYILDHRVQGVPLLHLSTHARIDPEHPGRSRILLASDSPTRADYLFQDEVGSLDLRDVGLVTLSACDTGRGKIVEGEGVQDFSQSFLAAGASATVTSLWKVADEPTASFMKQFYYSLVHGASKAEALRTAKLRFLRSNSALSSPRYWAAFVITGDGWRPTALVFSWSTVLIAVATALTAISLLFWGATALMAERRARRKAPQFA